MPVRNLKKSDRDIVLQMVSDFYNSPAVSHPIPTDNFAGAYDEMCDGGSERLRGLLIEHEGQPAGFCSLAFSYSTEAGGPVVLIEEIYIRPEYQKLGLGKATFQFIKDEYRGKAARLRLEAAPSNERAIALYNKLGFEPLPYIQLITEDY